MRQAILDCFVAVSTYCSDVDFDWHDPKSEANLRERGFDFEYASQLFENASEQFVDDRHIYGEKRYIAFGSIEGRRYAVVYTMRGETCWIISAFRCREKELHRWRERAAAAP